MINTVLVGLGAIGFQYDINLPESYVFTHAKACNLHPEYKIIYAVDSDIKKCKLFKKKYKSKTFLTINELPDNFSCQLVIISTPTEAHLDNVKKIVKKIKTKAILCEKPLAWTLKDSKKIVSICKKNNIKLFLNYIRRGDLGVINVRSLIKENKFKTPAKIVARYSKGIIHNGSHFIDLFYYWFGNLKSASVIKAGNSINNFDICPDVLLEYSNATVFLLSASKSEKDVFEATINFKNMVLHYKNSGSKITYEYYKSSKEPPTTCLISNSMDRYQLQILKLFKNELQGKKTSLCSGREALQSIEKVLSILKK
jgi:predicted dehydrogenase